MSDDESEPGAKDRARAAGAPGSEQKAYVAPVALPRNVDDDRRTRELRRVEIDPHVDPRRRPTVRRIPNADLPKTGPVLDDATAETTAPIGTPKALSRGTQRLEPNAPVASPSASIDTPPSEPDSRPGPVDATARGTMKLIPRKRGGTQALIVGMPPGSLGRAPGEKDSPWANESTGDIDRALLPSSRAPGTAGASPEEANRSRVPFVIAGAIVVVAIGLALALRSGGESSGAPSTPTAEPDHDGAASGPKPRSPSGPSKPQPVSGTTAAPPAAVAPSAAEPANTTAEATAAPAPSSAPAPNGAKPMAPKKVPPASKGPVPMFEREN